MSINTFVEVCWRTHVISSENYRFYAKPPSRHPILVRWWLRLWMIQVAAVVVVLWHTLGPEAINLEAGIAVLVYGNMSWTQDWRLWWPIDLYHRRQLVGSKLLFRVNHETYHKFLHLISFFLTSLCFTFWINIYFILSYLTVLLSNLYAFLLCSNTMSTKSESAYAFHIPFLPKWKRHRHFRLNWSQKLISSLIGFDA